MSAKGKQKKKAKLRFAEYYDLQDTLDKLYTDSQNGKLFQNLMPLSVQRKILNWLSAH